MTKPVRRIADVFVRARSVLGELRWDYDDQPRVVLNILLIAAALQMRHRRHCGDVDPNIKDGQLLEGALGIVDSNPHL
jgi:hypothetical protein